MANEDCPCRFCVPPKRHRLCHIDCPDWAEWKAKELEKQKRIREKKQKKTMLDGYQVQAVAHNRSQSGRAIGNKRWKDAYRSRMEDDTESPTDCSDGTSRDGNG